MCALSHNLHNASSKIILLVSHSGKWQDHPALGSLIGTLWNSIVFSIPAEPSQLFLFWIFPSVHILHYVWRPNLQSLASHNRIWISCVLYYMQRIIFKVTFLPIFTSSHPIFADWTKLVFSFLFSKTSAFFFFFLMPLFKRSVSLCVNIF